LRISELIKGFNPCGVLGLINSLELWRLPIIHKLQFSFYISWFRISRFPYRFSVFLEPKSRFGKPSFTSFWNHSNPRSIARDTSVRIRTCWRLNFQCEIPFLVDPIIVFLSGIISSGIRAQF
jgi:hypothetical protein